MGERQIYCFFCLCSHWIFFKIHTQKLQSLVTSTPHCVGFSVICSFVCSIVCLLLFLTILHYKEIMTYLCPLPLTRTILMLILEKKISRRSFIPRGGIHHISPFLVQTSLVYMKDDQSNIVLHHRGPWAACRMPPAGRLPWWLRQRLLFWQLNGCCA